MSVIDHDELQLHQTKNCPAIVNKEFDGPKPVTIIFVWKNDTSLSSSPHNNPHIVLSNLEDSIQLKKDKSWFTSDDIQIHIGNYTGQLVIENLMIPIPRFSINPTSQCVIISTSVHDDNESRVDVIVRDTDENLSDGDTTNDELNGNSKICIRNPNSGSDSNVIKGATMYVNYALNEQIALNQKIKACDRPSYSIKQNNGSATVTLNTFCFEIMRSNLIKFLNRSSQYKFYLCPKTDTQGRTPEDIIKVVKVNDVAKSETDMYTINLYRTTSRLMINGPHYNHFIENDLSLITEKFDSDDNRAIELGNKKIKDNLLKRKENNTATHLPTKDQTGVREECITQLTQKSSFETNFSLVPDGEEIGGTVEATDLYIQGVQIVESSVDSPTPFECEDEITDKDSRSSTQQLQEKATCDAVIEKSLNDGKSSSQSVKKLPTRTRKKSRKLADSLDVTLIDETAQCVKCKHLVRRAGVFCPKCNGWWHYRCADTNAAEVKKLGNDPFTCPSHAVKTIVSGDPVAELDESVTENQWAEVVETLKSQIENLNEQIEAGKLQQTEKDKQYTVLKQTLTKHKKDHSLEMENLKQQNRKLQAENASFKSKLQKSAQLDDVHEKRITTLKKTIENQKDTINNQKKKIMEIEKRLPTVDEENHGKVYIKVFY